ncbi:MAG: hypothetical protein IJ785_04930 [Bacteroidales bacterium]|nr:hypothetical protein [Bacteroidales bacterium]
MKNIENLLQRYSEGTITPEEQGELNRLTHRDEVFHAAEAEAHAIRRRRRATASTVAAVLILAGVLFTILPQNRLDTGDAPLIAQAGTGSLATPQQLSPALQSDAAANAQPAALPQPAQTVAAQAEHVHTSPAPATQPKPTQALESLDDEIEPLLDPDPIVACNTQCSPDSVINDIWNFLRA